MPPETVGVFTKILKGLSEKAVPSDAVTVNVEVVSTPTVEAVPEITPVDEFKLSPVGKDPEEIEYEIVLLKAVADNVKLNTDVTSGFTVPILPAGVFQETMLLIVMLNDLLIVEFAESVTDTVNVYVVLEEIPDGVPDITPVDVFSVSPTGKEPAVIANVSGELSGSVANADIGVIADPSENVPSVPEE